MMTVFRCGIECDWFPQPPDSPVWGPTGPQVVIVQLQKFTPWYMNGQIAGYIEEWETIGTLAPQTPGCKIWVNRPQPPGHPDPTVLHPNYPMHPSGVYTVRVVQGSDIQSETSDCTN